MIKLIYSIIIVIYTLLAGAGYSQTSRGIKPANDAQTFSGSTKLVVVGVSKYQNIQSLNYAHTDAQAFYNFMISKDGGNIESASAKLLLNEQATAANIFAALDWLLANTQEGETVIFYFAGHGDLETKTIMQNGFLLANDSPQNVYVAGGTVPVRFLQDYLTTLTQQNKARVILITDACRSGKLAGGMEGVANTATALQTQWENTVKILSSQPGELSYEGNQWNGGGGVFTYYLVKGLMGFADRNRDYKITLNEINVYLNDNIPQETQFAQNPSVIGNPSTVLSHIDSVAFSSIKNKESKLEINNKQIAMRGMEDDYKKILDTATYRQYKDFRYCIEHGFLIKSHEKYGNATRIYEKLKDDTKAKQVIGAMKSSLIAALQNRTQNGINTFMKGENPHDSIGFIISGELDYALSLIDSGNIVYKSVKARRLMLQCFMNEFSKPTLEYVNEAIALEPDFALAYFVRGQIYQKNNIDMDAAIGDFDKALSLAPGWVNAIRGRAKTLQRQSKTGLAKAGYDLCIRLNSLYFPAYTSYAILFDQSGKRDSALYFMNKADSVATILKDPELMSEMAGMYLYGKDTVNAIHYYEKCIDMGTKFMWAYCQLSDLYGKKNNAEKAAYYKKECLEHSISRYHDMIRYTPDNFEQRYLHYYNIAACSSLLQRKDDALKYLELAIKEGMNDFKYIKKDADLDNIRNTPEFKALIKKYKK